MKTKRAIRSFIPPSGIGGVIWRFYPLIGILLSIPIGTELGAILAHGDASLGHPLVPYVYRPWDGFAWFAHYQAGSPMETAARAFGYTILGSAMLVFGQMLIDYAHGRSWGFFDSVIFIMLMWNSLDMTLRGYPPSFSWFGEGGVIDREYAKELSRRPTKK